MTIEEAEAEIARLRDIVAWCRPRLRLEVYMRTCDRLMAGSTKHPADEPRIVQSKEPAT